MVFSDGMPGRMVRDCEYDTSLDGYDAIGVMLGINDLIHYYSVDMIVKQMKIFLDSLEHPFLILMSVPIMKDACKELNDAYKKMGYPYIELDALDFSFDGIHLSEKGHKQLADMVVSQIGGLTL